MEREASVLNVALFLGFLGCDRQSPAAHYLLDVVLDLSCRCVFRHAGESSHGGPPIPS